MHLIFAPFLWFLSSNPKFPFFYMFMPLILMCLLTFLDWSYPNILWWSKHYVKVLLRPLKLFIFRFLLKIFDSFRFELSRFLKGSFFFFDNILLILSFRLLIIFSYFITVALFYLLYLLIYFINSLHFWSNDDFSDLSSRIESFFSESIFCILAMSLTRGFNASFIAFSFSFSFFFYYCNSFYSKICICCN